MKDLTHFEKLLAIYCFTSPQSNRIGLYVLSPGHAEEDLGPLDDTVCHTVAASGSSNFGYRISKICEALNWRYDTAARVLFLPTWWKYNPPDNPKSLQGYLEDIHDLPQTNLLAEFAQNKRYLSDTLCHTLSTTLTARYPELSDTVCHTLPPQEQEQEQEFSAEKTKSKPKPKRKPKPKPKPKKNGGLYNAVAETFGLTATSRNGSRIGAVVSGLREHGATPDEVRRRRQVYSEVWPGIDCTPEALLKHWDRMASAASEVDDYSKLPNGEGQKSDDIEF